MTLPVFFQAPHRVLFFTGLAQLLLAALWWLSDIADRYVGWHDVMVDFPLPARYAHASLLIFLTFPLFFFGFLMTALPRWQNAEPIRPGEYIQTCGLFVLAILLVWLSLFFSERWPWLWADGLMFAAAAIARGAFAIGRRAMAPHPDGRHAKVVTAIMAGGAVIAVAASLGQALADYALLRFAVQAGVWAFLAPVFFVVLHRMLPFFSSVVIPDYAVYRPFPLLWGMIVALVGHGVLAGLGFDAWVWLVDAPGAAIATHLTLRWQLRKSFAVRLLAMLHMGSAWLAVAFVLSAVQSLLLLAGVGVGGLAPLHALTVGVFGSVVLAMATRVTLGHSGHPLMADNRIWRLFVLMQGIALLRVLVDFWPSASGLGYAVAALGWLLVFGVWGARFAPVYLRPRPDGKAG